MNQDRYDVIVVGAGHAGNEAAAAAANMGSSVLMITMNMQTIGQMSCNPAMGGIAKGQIIREVDALGGYSGIISDKTMIQFRMLNKSKGPAMWSPRVQSDRHRFAWEWRRMLEQTPNLDFYQDMVSSIIIEKGKATGVITGMGRTIRANAIIITSGTFLNGEIHIGEKRMGGGRMGEKAAEGITEQLQAEGMESSRLKTGTPPRIDGRSINYSVMEEQKGDEEIVGFSYLKVPKISAAEQRSCHITYTSPEVHEILKSGFDRSPMYTGRIEGTGPRYCPSIEDKINRFADRERHQLFVEPEGCDTVEVYVNGFSTSLPEEVQIAALRKVPGMEQAKFFRPGYAIEYDYFQPHQLKHTLETKAIDNLYFAGQINGTTGYEEAACQGLMAGMNAHLKIKNQAPFILQRSDAYIGVLIDDLINKGTEEPYRMFTSRAEFRTLLRQDNADLRLTGLSFDAGLADKHRYGRMLQKQQEVSELKNWMDQTFVQPGDINGHLETWQTALTTEKQKLSKLILRPQIQLEGLSAVLPDVREYLLPYDKDSILQAEIQVKYERYIEKEQELVDKMKTLENLQIPLDFDYGKMPALSAEAIQKFRKVRPATLGQASRISGVNPSDVQILMVYMGR